MLGDAAAHALTVARREAEGDGAPPPRRLRPMLDFRGASSSRHATEVVLNVLEDQAAFRSLVAESATEDAVGRAGWLYLRRPDGWQAELDLLVAGEEERRDHLADAEEERSASHRVRGLERTVEDLRNRLEMATVEAARAAEELGPERARRQVAERERHDLERRVEAADAARDRATAELASARRTSDERLLRVRELEESVADLRAARGRWAAPAVEALDGARVALARLQAAISDVAEHVDPTTATAAAGPAQGRDSDSSPKRRRGRRIPVRLERGAIDGTVEATDQLLRIPDVVVLVDGYNVSIAGWPHLDVTAQRASLQSMLTTLSARTAAEVRVVFDGDDDGCSPVLGAASPLRIRYTPAGVEADDVLIEMAREIPQERPVVVVSSDHRVRDGVAAVGANTVSSAALLAWCRR